MKCEFLCFWGFVCGSFNGGNRVKMVISFVEKNFLLGDFVCPLYCRTQGLFGSLIVGSVCSYVCDCLLVDVVVYTIFFSHVVND